MSLQLIRPDINLDFVGKRYFLKRPGLSLPKIPKAVKSLAIYLGQL